MDSKQAKDPQALREQIWQKARELGANLIGCAPAGRWETEPLQAEGFRPRRIWPWVNSVIVLGIPLFAPMMLTTPSMVYQELYDTSNRVLDDLAYRLSNYITTECGCRAIYFPRDCYYSIDVLLKNPNAAFSHVIAGYYAGLGTIGDSHNLITKEFGPRLRLVSILTDAALPADEMQEKQLCLHCGKCLRSCPSHAFSEDGPGRPYRMDKLSCTAYHVKLRDAHHWPCGVCAGVCPVGEDLRAWHGAQLVTPEGVKHCQAFGS